MADPETHRAAADALIDRIEATRTVSAECEHFGLLAQDVVDWSRAQRGEAEQEARELLRSTYVEILEVVSPHKKGEAAGWRKTTAARYVDGVKAEGLVDALRAITRLRVAVERAKG